MTGINSFLLNNLKAAARSLYHSLNRVRSEHGMRSASIPNQLNHRENETGLGLGLTLMQERREILCLHHE
jgi:hypothetical protein